MMRRGLILLMMIALATLANAQQMGIEDFSRLKRPFWKRSKVTVDKQKAIIDLYTQEKGFAFTANGKEAAEAEEGDGVITVKVPTKTHHLTIKHPQYGTLTWRVPVKYLKRKKHYRATLLATDSTKKTCPYSTEYPTVVAEFDAFLASAAAEQEETQYSQKDTRPLPEVQLLAEDNQRTQQHHYRTSGIDRAYYRNWQVLNSDISKQPTAQHNTGLEKDVALHRPSAKGRMESYRQEDNGAEQGIEEEDGDDGIVLQSMFLADIIEAQQGCTHKGKG